MAWQAGTRLYILRHKRQTAVAVMFSLDTRAMYHMQNATAPACRIWFLQKKAMLRRVLLFIVAFGIMLTLVKLMNRIKVCAK